MVTNHMTKPVSVGSLQLGGGAPVRIQSMLNVPSNDLSGNVAQAKALAEAGCEIIRVAIPDEPALALIPAIKRAVDVPLVADIHFDYRLALGAVANGVDKVRINPGNIGEDSRVKEVADACRRAGVPIRIGVNSGSVESHILAKYGGVTAAAMVESGLYHVSLLERFDFNDIVLSLKASDTKMMYDAYVLAAEQCAYPLHLGVTEAGTYENGVIKSAAGIGGLLLRGIGDTVRVSLTDDPVREVEAAQRLLQAVGLRRTGVRFVSCPTCGRTRIDLIGLAHAVEERFSHLPYDLTIAVMGCVVNGPGEAQHADYGIAGGKGCGVIFKKGKIVASAVPEAQLLDRLEALILENEQG